MPSDESTYFILLAAAQYCARIAWNEIGDTKWACYFASYSLTSVFHSFAQSLTKYFNRFFLPFLFIQIVYLIFFSSFFLNGDYFFNCMLHSIRESRYHCVWRCIVSVHPSEKWIHSFALRIPIEISLQFLLCCLFRCSSTRCARLWHIHIKIFGC